MSLFRGPSKPARSEATLASSSSRTPVAPPSAVPMSTLVKVALLGDSQVGKTSLMVRYVEGGFDETQLQTQGARLPCASAPRSRARTLP